MMRMGTDYVFLVLGNNAWGKGNTETLAVASARKAGGSMAAVNYFLYLVPPSASVDELGRIVWSLEEGKPDNCILLKYVRKGKEQWPIPD